MTDEPQKDQEEKLEIPENIGEGRRILIVDDDPTTIELLKELLNKVGFEVIAATNGKEAWDTLKPDTMPQLIVLDMMMPEMDGFEFLKQLKNNDESKGIPTIVLTERKNMEDAFLSVGVNEFIPKPLITETFLEKATKLALTAPIKEPDTKTEET